MTIQDIYIRILNLVGEPTVETAKIKKPYVGLWYEVRKEFGIPDIIYFGSLNTKTNELNLTPVSHTQVDGIAGQAMVLREDGYPSYPLPKTGEKRPPLSQLIKLVLKALTKGNSNQM